LPVIKFIAMIRYFLFAAFLTVSALNVNAQADVHPDYLPFIEKYRHKFTDELAGNKISGLSIAVVDNNKVIWCEGFGSFNKSQPVAVTGSTPFLIGSITKTFTALAIMQLYEEGKLDIDSTVQTYLPEFHLRQINGEDQKATIRQLMTHHGGIPDFLTNKHPKEKKDMSLILDYVNRDFATYPPNTIYSYSNPGIGLLGLVIERVTHQTFPEYVTQHILEPLKMGSSGIFSFNDMPLSVKTGYNSDLSEKSEYPGLILPSGGIYSSAADMANYIKMWLNKGEVNGERLIAPETAMEMMRIQNADIKLDLGLPLGLVWNIIYNSAGKCLEHEGGTQWHRSEICIAPEAGLGIIILTNSLKGGSMTYLSRSEMLSELVRIKQCDTTGFSVEPRYECSHRFSLKENPEIIPVPISYEEKKSLSGNYGTFGEMNVIELKDSSLFTRYYGHDLYLLPVNNNEFVVSPSNSYEQANPANRFYFGKFRGVDNLIEIDRNGGFAHYGERIEPSSLPDDWKLQLGEYKVLPDDNSESSLTDFNLVYDKGILLLKAKLTKDYGVPDPVIPLKIVSDSVAVVYGYGRYGGQAAIIIKDPSDTKRILRFMNQDMILKEALPD
jgi:CubicO group peptidase (beta-lactamase class C family)